MRPGSAAWRITSLGAAELLGAAALVSALGAAPDLVPEERHRTQANASNTTQDMLTPGHGQAQATISGIPNLNFGAPPPT